MTVQLMSSDARQRFLALLDPKCSLMGRVHLREPGVLFLERLLDDEEMWDCTFQVPLKIEHNLVYKRGRRWDAGYYRCYWLFQNRLYVIKNQSLYSDDESALLVREEFDKSRRKFERLKSKFENDSVPRASRRERISESVRIEVWRRDGGKCARCGSRERLEYDHIIPVSKGGANTARNIELLCESCNRAKANRIE